MKKRKVNETKELEQSMVQMSNRISTYMEKKVCTERSADDAFMEFIKVRFNSIPDEEKDTRRKILIDTLTAPLSEK